MVLEDRGSVEDSIVAQSSLFYKPPIKEPGNESMALERKSEDIIQVFVIRVYSYVFVNRIWLRTLCFKH